MRRQEAIFFSYGSTVLYEPNGLTYRRFLELFRHMVGLLGRVISPLQGLYLHRTTQHRKTRDKHPCLELDSNPRSQQPRGQDPRLRPHGHCDWRETTWKTINMQQKFVSRAKLELTYVKELIMEKCFNS
jgi:hypothetical protein